MKPVGKPIRVITLPNGKSVSLGCYVKSWQKLLTLHPESTVTGWDHFSTRACEILQAISYGVHDRINRHLPWRNGRRWQDEAYHAMRTDAIHVNEYQRIRHSGCRGLLRTPELQRRYPHINCQEWKD